MEHPYSLREIQKRTGLKYDFLRRLVKEIPELGDAYAVQGLNNAFMFNENGLACFREIANMKEQQYTLPTIRDQVLLALPNEVKKVQNHGHEPQPSVGTKENVLLQLLETAQHNERENYRIALEAKEAVISHQKQTIQALEGGLRLLTDGRSPDEVRRENQQKEEELRNLQNAEKQNQDRILRERQIMEDLQKTRWYQKKKRQLLLHNLAELLNSN